MSALMSAKILHQLHHLGRETSSGEGDVIWGGRCHLGRETLARAEPSALPSEARNV